MISLARAAYDDIVYRAYEGGEADICGVLAGEHGDDGDPSVVTCPSNRKMEPCEKGIPASVRASLTR